MSENQGEAANQTATRRAEQALDSVGRSIGLFAGTTGQRFQQAVRSVFARSEQSEQTSPSKPEEAGQPALERAEGLVHIAEERIGQWAGFTGHQSQRLLARLREDVEDMWAEAQNIRGKK
jgi:hypothetical protein